MHEGEPDEVDLRDKDSDQSNMEPVNDTEKMEKSLRLHIRKSIYRNIDEFGRKKGVSIYKQYDPLSLQSDVYWLENGYLKLGFLEK